MIVFDTNAVLRYILQDMVDIADYVESQMQREKYMIPVEVLAEIVYVLEKVYKIDRQRIAHELVLTVNEPNALIPHKQVVEKALQVYDQTKLDFVDCLLIGYAKIEGHRIISYDKKLNNYLTANGAVSGTQT
ncbi:MAG: PIN domain-containing protein [Planctomycetaceae bacterium]|nr:PIN domain-containing protein [Planctomycetaceae bacterium]